MSFNSNPASYIMLHTNVVHFRNDESYETNEWIETNNILRIRRDMAYVCITCWVIILYI